MRDFRVFVLAPTGCEAPALMEAAAAAGAIGVRDLNGGAAPTRMGRGRGDGLYVTATEQLGTALAANPTWLIVPASLLDVEPERLERFRAGGGRLVAEVSGWRADLTGLEDRIDAWWAKGHEAGGLVGEDSAFVLLQTMLRYARRPVSLRGGVGIHTAAGAAVCGAAGVVLDDQTLLLDESPLKDRLRTRLAAFSGSETVLLEDRAERRYLRIWSVPGDTAAADLRTAIARRGRIGPDDLDRLGWGDDQVHPLGQAAAVASDWAARFGTLRRVVRALRTAVREHPRTALRAGPLAPSSSLAAEHGTALPIVQGPMTHVSDRAEFLEAVAGAGALPMAAISLMRGEALRTLLRETADRLTGRPWGVGLLGFVDQDLRAEQLAAIRAARPPFAIIAGGRPDQALDLEAEGVRTYLHAASPAILETYLERGARRFILEGRECGGHIGPVTSLPLWERAVEQIRAFGARGGRSEDISLLLAGGIHDARSAVMAAVAVAPLADLGVRVGFLMGTAYVFTDEAVRTGAITPGFQSIAVSCTQTVGLEGGTGYVSRCAATPVVEDFLASKRALEDEGADPTRIRDSMEAFSLGRLRLATKGLMRAGHNGPLTARSEDEQRQGGLYMMGQVAALRESVCTIADVHRAVCEDAVAYLRARCDALASVSAQQDLAPADIAIVGVATILPGAMDPEAYWAGLLSGENRITEIPPDRWDIRTYFDPDRSKQDRVHSKWGGFIADVPFDPVEYGIPPASLRSIDPMQLLALELVRRALSDAGLESDAAPDLERASVVLGFSGGLGELGLEYGTRSALPSLSVEETEGAGRLPQWTEDSFAGLLPNVAAGRVANRLNFGGTNMTVDAACASSLAAIYQAVLELETGRSDVVVTGGVDTLLAPFGYFCFAKTGALSPTGQCRTFDSAADGIIISEGLGAVVLKRLADAERDGDHIRAVIKGVGASSDGRARGITAPTPLGQGRALRRAYAQAGFSPATVGLFEAHGTGTVAGDRAELESLTQVLREAAADPASCAVGSAKTLIGHTKATAGVAGLIKVMLALQHRTIPPHWGVTTPNPALNTPGCPVYLARSPRPWVRSPSTPRRAGVSAFGFGGTNFHVVLEEHDGEDRPAGARGCWPVELFVFRAPDAAALAVEIERVRDEVAATTTLHPATLARTLAGRLPSSGRTLCVTAGTRSDLLARLDAGLTVLRTGQPAPRGVCWADEPLGGTGRLAVVFSGQGAQQPGMLQDVATLYPDMIDALDEGERVLAETPTFAGRRIAPLIYPPDRFDPADAKRDRAALTSTDVAQPALGVLQSGLWAVLQGLGVRPDMVAGHSYGEYAALHAAGVMDRRALLTLSEARGRLILEGAAGAEPGTMAAVTADAATVERHLADLPGVVCANLNSPRQTVISGAEEAVRAAVVVLEEAGLVVKPVNVSVAFHSPILEEARSGFAKVLDSVPFQPPTIPVYANTTARAHAADPIALKEAMARHLTAPVRWRESVAAMYEDGARMFLEVGPRRILCDLVSETLGERPHAVFPVDGGDVEGHLLALGGLLAHGVALDPARLFDGRGIAPEASGAAGVGLSPTTWLVNGGYARPHTAPPRTFAPTLMPAAPVVPPDEARPVLDEEESMVHDTRRGASPTADDAMTAWQETMRQFLRTQENVMRTYLGAAQERPGHDVPMPVDEPIFPVEDEAVPRAAPVTPRPEEPAFVNEPLAAPFAPPPPAPLPPTPTATPEPPPARAPADILIAVVEQRTGYPPEMLDVSQKLEADLGIDSVKKVEILGAFQKSLPATLASALEGAQEKLSAAETLQQIIDIVKAVDVPGDAPAPFDEAGEEEIRLPPVPLPRYVVRSRAEAADHVTLETVRPDLSVLTDDGQGVARRLAARLEQAGGTALVLPAESLAEADALIARTDGPVSAVLHLAPLAGGVGVFSPDDDQWMAGVRRDIVNLFPVLRSVAGRLADTGTILTVSATGGLFGRGGLAPEHSPTAAAPLGLLKALDFEWPRWRMKGIDLDPGEGIEAWVEHLWRELLMPAGRREVGYPGGIRTIFRTEPASLIPSVSARRPAPDGTWVVLAIGGGRGITAECLPDFAAAGARLVLVGRSPLAAERPDLADVSGQDLRQRLIEEARASRQPARPRDVEARVSAVLRDREIRSTIDMLSALGGEVTYRPCDLTDATATKILLDSIYDEFQRIDVVLFGAGVIEDALLVNKREDSVRRVVDAKVTAARHLVQALRPSTLSALFFFTSVAGRFGNPGQTDYAAANEALNRLAWQLHAAWKDTVRVAAVNWGPWEPRAGASGMVSEQNRAQFEQRGVRLVSPDAGRRFLWREMLYGAPGDVELVAGESPWEYVEASHGALPPADEAPTPLEPAYGLLVGSVREGASVRCLLDLVSAPYLDHHRLDGAPVMPFTGAMELMAEAARVVAGQERPVRALEAVSWYRGLIVPEAGLDVVLSVAQSLSGESWTVRITPAGLPNRPYYSGAVVFGEGEAPPPESLIGADPGAPAEYPSLAEIYEKWLFHGPVFQRVEALLGLSTRRVSARLRSTSPGDLHPLLRAGAAWVFDPALMDACLQLVCIWARAVHGKTALPTRIERIERFAPVPEGALVTAVLDKVSDQAEEAGVWTIHVLDGVGACLVRVTGLEIMYSRDLNRLGGGWAGGTVAQDVGAR